MEEIAKAGSAWLSYDIHQGKWTTIINQAGTSVASLDDSNIVGEIAISGTSLTQLNNVADVKYQNADILDKTDFVKISIPSGSLYQNEPRSSLQLSLPFTNKQAVALKLGLQLLKQARVDKIIKFNTDYSYINLRAGDLISITNSIFGYTNKMFRIITAEEVEADDGAIQVQFTCLEYNADVYSYNITEYAVETNDGLLNIASIGKPGTPQVTKFEIDSRPRINIESLSPTGVVEGMEFWLSSDTAIPEEQRNYRLLGSRYPNNTGTYTQGTNVTFEYDSLGTTDFFIKTRGFNAIVQGQFSDPSGLIQFKPTQVTNAIDADTAAIDATGNLLTALAVIDLIKGVDKLFAEDSSSGGLFDKVFKTFKNVTGVDLIELFGGTTPGTLIDGDETATGAYNAAVSGNLLTNITTPDPAKTYTVKEFVVGGTTYTTPADALITNVGTFNVAVNGDWSFTPANNYVGSVPVLTYKATDGTLEDSSTLTISAIVKPADAKVYIEVSDKFPPDRTTYQDPISGATSDAAPTTGNYYLKFTASSFYGALSAGTGSAKLYSSDGFLKETLAANQLTFNNNVVTFPFASREKGTDYYIIADEGLIKYCDRISRAFAGPGDWNFNTPLYTVAAYTAPAADAPLSGSTVIPTISSVSPSSTSCPSANLIITFSNSVVKGSGNLYIKSSSNNATVKTIAADSGTVTGNSINYGSLSTLAGGDYYLTADAGIAVHQQDCYVTAPSAAIVKFDNITFTIQGAPVVQSFEVNSSPIANDTQRLKVNPQTNIRIIFDKNISFAASGTINIYKADGSLHQAIAVNTSFSANKTNELIWIAGSSLYLNPTKDLTLGATYYVTAVGDCVKDSCNLAWGGTSNANLIRFTVDAGPVSIVTPISVTSTTIELTYDRGVTVGNSDITIRDSNNNIVKTISTTDPAVTYS
jgi:hypothetical protein